MKRILVSAAALTLLIGSPALAQDNGHKDNGGKHNNAAPARADKGGGGNHNGGGRGDGGDRNGGGGNHGAPNGGGNHGAPNGGGGGRGPAANFQPDRGHDRNDRNFNGNGGRDNHNPNWNQNNNRNPNWNQNNNRNPNWNRNGNMNRGNMQRPRTFDRRQYQRNFNAQRRFRAGAYRRPNGFYYRRWGFGQILPFAFFARDYWLNDYYAYDLAVPPYGYEWVRYGDDAILVDVRTGAILQVEYGVFY